MSSTHTITILKPDGTGSITPDPLALDLNLQTEDPGTLVLDFDTVYSTLTSAYENGKVTYTRQATGGTLQTLFVGKILKVERVQDAGKQRIRLQAIDLKASMDATIGGRNSNTEIITSTETLELSNYGLTRDGIPVTSEGFYRYYPDHDATETPDSTSPWIAVSSSDYAPQALVDGLTGAAATEILTQSTTDQGFPPRGLLYTDSAGILQEIIYYDGYAPDPANSNQYKFWNCVRGCLGTTPNARNTGAQLSGRAVKPIDSTNLFTVEGYTGSAWDEIDPNLYRINAELGTVDFFGDLTATPYSFTDFRYSGTHYDVDNASAETLATLVQGIMEYSKAQGGMGLTVTTDFVINWPRIPLLEDVGNERPMYTRDILDLLAQTYEPYAFTAKGLGYWYNPNSGKFEFEEYAQAGTADVDLSSVKPKAINQKFNTGGQYSSVLVQYKPSRANLNLLAGDRVYHPDRGDTVGGQTLTGFTYMFADLANAGGWLKDSTSNGNNVYGSALVDGNDNTGAGLYFTTNPGDAFYAFDLWFPGSPDTYELDWLEVVLDFRNYLPPGVITNVKIVGWTGYTPGDPPTRTGETYLAGFQIKNGSVNPIASPWGQPLNRR